MKVFFALLATASAFVPTAPVPAAVSVQGNLEVRFFENLARARPVAVV
jgi:hypothetical protein